MINYDAEYGLQTVLFVSRTAAHGDYKTLEGFGIRSDQIERLLSLNPPTMNRLANIGRANFLAITIDPKALDIALDLSENDAQRMDLIFRMLQAGASYPVMQALFGLTTADVANYKRFLKIPVSNGRPPMPSDSEQTQLWEIFKDLDALAEQLPEVLLQAHDETGVRIDCIWRLWHQWRDSCNEETTLLAAEAAG